MEIQSLIHFLHQIHSKFSWKNCKISKWLCLFLFFSPLPHYFLSIPISFHRNSKIEWNTPEARICHLFPRYFIESNRPIKICFQGKTNQSTFGEGYNYNDYYYRNSTGDDVIGCAYLGVFSQDKSELEQWKNTVEHMGKEYKGCHHLKVDIYIFIYIIILIHINRSIKKFHEKNVTICSSRDLVYKL